MKKYILPNIAAIWVACLLHSCTEDKVYDMGGWSSRTVEFSACNLDLDSLYSVESTAFDDYYDLDYHNTSFSLEYYTLYNTDTYHTTITTDRESVLWAGGYNNIQITFQPSDPEEKEAVFTMPDGSTRTATTERPTFVWTPDSTMPQRYYYVDNTVIEAESSYSKGSIKYQNKGFIFVYLDSELRYNRYENRWYSSQWLYK